MKSPRAKVLHELCGRPLVDFVIEAALAAGADDAVVVVGHQREEVCTHLQSRFGAYVRTAVQDEQRGTGHAVGCAMSELASDCKTALLLYGDTPLVLADDLARLVSRPRETLVSMLTCQLDAPHGYGRILRDDDGQIVAIREERDANAAERKITEVNPGMYAVEANFLRDALAALEPNNEQGELYLTDIIAMAAVRAPIPSFDAPAHTLGGINDRAQLAAAEHAMHARIATLWRRAGVTIKGDTHIDADVQLEPDACIEHGVVLRGQTRVCAGARVDVGCVLDDVVVEAGAYLKPYSVCSASHIGPNAQVGPLAHLRPDTKLGRGAKVGNFVETKNVELHDGAKASHLSYLGDGEIGAGANIGAGTIFCNYDGFQKHRTVIGEGAFIGSDSQLVAPVSIGDGAYVATGTTVTKDVPADGLAISRTRQENKEGYAKRLRGRLQAAKAAKKDASE